MVTLAHVSVKNFASVTWFAMFTTLNPYGQAANWASVVSFGAVALVLVAATRGRLGYRPGLHDDGGAKVFDERGEPHATAAQHDSTTTAATRETTCRSRSGA